MIEIEAVWKRAFNGYHLTARDRTQWPVKNSNLGKYCWDMDYTEGQLPPNYPAPAIACSVQWHDGKVLITDFIEHDEWLDYRFTYYPQ